jgi:hypothetical protein
LHFGSGAALAQVAITEAAPWSSGNSPVGADWFELTNIGSSAVDISGWRMDDSSLSFATARPLRGITTIGAGRSVILVESDAAGAQDSMLRTAFLDTWFGDTSPAGLQIGFYGGAGVGLGTGGDAVAIFDSGGSLRASVSFGASPAAVPFASYDNAAALDGVTLSQLSSVGVNGAFLAAAGSEIGSPGFIAAVPEPETYAMMLLGLGLVGAATRMRRR